MFFIIKEVFVDFELFFFLAEKLITAIFKLHPLLSKRAHFCSFICVLDVVKKNVENT